MVYHSLLKTVEDDDPKQFFIGLMNDIIRKWKHDGASTWRRGRILMQTLERGGFLEALEKELLHNASSEDRRNEEPWISFAVFHVETFVTKPYLRPNTQSSNHKTKSEDTPTPTEAQLSSHRNSGKVHAQSTTARVTSIKQDGSDFQAERETPPESAHSATASLINLSLSEATNTVSRLHVSTTSQCFVHKLTFNHKQRHWLHLHPSCFCKHQTKWNEEGVV
ncbi:hypothetical protein BLNAU_5198 [Blattamonas nauphoetae]|uniref:Uncharacterized protein n=1 Tax=Blattamonas nauphoetae TaxID=2049346 RepID=A0ABQ9Y7Q5_9EUKA|nr:hypothetical protein BLNAU_5198 [Blattamonas nauphoetae]